MSNVIIGFDQAPRVTGYCVMGPEQNLIEVGAKQHYSLLENKQFLTGLLETYKPEFVVFEDIQLQRNVATFKSLAQLQGVYISTLDSMAINYEISSPSHWRAINKLKAPNRAQAKRAAQELCGQLWPDQKFSQDSAEAALIARSYYLQRISF